MSFVVYSPLSGTVVPIEEVPDAAFAEKMLGDGVAVIPDTGVVAAPANGVISALPASGHAFGMELTSGVELLVHVGIDTVEMNGTGFHLLAAKGDHIQVGQKLIEFDIEAIKAAGKAIVSPVVVMGSEIKMLAQGHIAIGDPLFEIEDALS